MENTTQTINNSWLLDVALMNPSDAHNQILDFIATIPALHVQLTEALKEQKLARETALYSKRLTQITNEVQNKLLTGRPLVIIMRGLPGSGKSTLAKNLAALSKNSVIASTYDYYINDKGEYIFQLFPPAHSICFQKFERAINSKTSLIIIDNTNIKQSDIEPYVKFLLFHKNYQVMIVDMETPWARNVAECAKKSIHSVPIEMIMRMNENYLPISIQSMKDRLKR